MSSIYDQYNDRFGGAGWFDREVAALQREMDAERLRMFVPRFTDWSKFNVEVSTAKPKETWLDKAKNISTNDRRKAYGHPLPNFLRAAIAFTPILGHPITPLQVAELQVSWKVVRDVNTFKDDNWIDTIGYSNTVQMMDDRMKEMNYSGIDWFRPKKDGILMAALYEVLTEHEKRFPKSE